MAEQGGGGGNVPIIKVNIDTEEWDAFQEKFKLYQESLKAQPEQWRAHQEGISGVAGAFGGAKSEFDKFAKATSSSKLSGESSFISRFVRESDLSEKSWKKITKEIEKSGKGMTDLARLSLGLGLGGVATKLGGAAVGAAGAVLGAAGTAAGDLADKNKSSRSLDLEIGKEQIFENDYKQFGLGAADLHNMADIKADIRKWVPLISAGFSPEQIKSSPVDELTFEFARRADQQYSAWEKAGLPAATIAQSRGYTDILSTDQMRTGGSYGDDAWQTQHKNYGQDWPKAAVDQKTADQATAAKKDIANAWTGAVNNFEAALVPLAPKLADLTTAVGSAVTAFAKSDDLKKGVEVTISAFDAIGKAGGWLADKLNGAMGVDPTKNPDNKIKVAPNSVAAWGLQYAVKAQADLIKNHKAGHDFGVLGKGEAPPPHWDWNHPFGTMSQDPATPAGSTWDWPWNKPTATTAPGAPDAPHSTSNSLDNVLSAIRMNESSGNPNAVNPTTGAAGAYGLMPNTARQYGVSPFDEVASRGAAQKVLENFLSHFHGNMGKAVAAYDGDTHIDSDTKEFKGDWLRGAKPETLDYLNKMQKQGVDLGLMDSDKQYIAKALASVNKSSPRQTDDTQAGRGGQDRMFGFKMPANNPQQAPINLNVTVTAPAGSHVAMSAGGLPQ
jgi:Transglycosylase SLT domain